MKTLLVLALIICSVALIWEHQKLMQARGELATRINQLGAMDHRATTCEAELEAGHQLLHQVAAR